MNKEFTDASKKMQEKKAASQLIVEETAGEYTVEALQKQRQNWLSENFIFAWDLTEAALWLGEAHPRHDQYEPWRRKTIEKFGTQIIRTQQAAGYDPATGVYLWNIFLWVNVHGKAVAQIAFILDGRVSEIGAYDSRDNWFVPGEWMIQAHPLIEKMKAAKIKAQAGAEQEEIDRLKAQLLIGEVV